MAEEVEVFLEVGVAVGVVRADAVAGEVGLGGGVEGGGEGIGPGSLSPGSSAAIRKNGARPWIRGGLSSVK